MSANNGSGQANMRRTLASGTIPYAVLWASLCCAALAATVLGEQPQPLNNSVSFAWNGSAGATGGGVAEQLSRFKAFLTDRPPVAGVLWKTKSLGFSNLARWLPSGLANGVTAPGASVETYIYGRWAKSGAFVAGAKDPSALLDIPNPHVAVLGQFRGAFWRNSGPIVESYVTESTEWGTFPYILESLRQILRFGIPSVKDGTIVWSGPLNFEAQTGLGARVMGALQLDAVGRPQELQYEVPGFPIRYRLSYFWKDGDWESGQWWPSRIETFAEKSGSNESVPVATTEILSLDIASDGAGDEFLDPKEIFRDRVKVFMVISNGVQYLDRAGRLFPQGKRFSSQAPGGGVIRLIVLCVFTLLGCGAVALILRATCSLKQTKQETARKE